MRKTIRGGGRIAHGALAACVAFAALAGGAPAAEAFPPVPMQATAPPSGVTIQGVTASGMGCPDASAVSVMLSPNRRSIVLRLAEGRLRARVGPGIPRSAAGTSCLVQLTLGVPAGYQASIGAVTYNGYAELDPGVRAFHSTRYWFLGTRAPVVTRQLEGPMYSEPYTLYADYGPIAVSSSCRVTSTLSMNVQLGMVNVSNPSGYGQIDLGGSGTSIVYNLNWSRC